MPLLSTLHTLLVPSPAFLKGVYNLCGQLRTYRGEGTPVCFEVDHREGNLEIATKDPTVNRHTHTHAHNTQTHALEHTGTHSSNRIILRKMDAKAMKMHWPRKIAETFQTGFSSNWKTTLNEALVNRYYKE